MFLGLIAFHEYKRYMRRKLINVNYFFLLSQGKASTPGGI